MGDDAQSALASCSSDSSKLTNKAANHASMTAAKEKMNSLATSRSVGGGDGGRAAGDISSCTDIITISQTIVKHANNFPQSPKIATYANKIVAATVTCTTEEKT